MADGVPEGYRVIRSDPALLRITQLHILLDCALVIVVVAVPAFVDDVLRTEPRNAVYIFAPGALGMIFGLVLTPVLLRFVSPRAIVTLGFVLVLGVIFILPFVQEIADELERRTFVPLQRIEDLLLVRREIATTVLLLPFGGLGIIMVRIASRAAVYEHAPANAIARVFATQSGIGSIATLLPALLSGLLVDTLDVRTVLVLTGVLVSGLTLVALFGPTKQVLPLTDQTESQAPSTSS